MTETPWFQDRAVDEHDPIVIYRLFFIPSLLVVALLFLYGCASKPEVVTKVCEMKYLGKSDKGNPLFLSMCESTDKFVADNK